MMNRFRSAVNILLTVFFFNCLPVEAGQIVPSPGQPEISAPDTGKPGGEEGLTLTTAAEIALRHNPLVQATSSAGQIAAAQLSEAHAGRWPLLQFSETFTTGTIRFSFSDRSSNNAGSALKTSISVRSTTPTRSATSAPP